ncbi:MAG: hypothetical protein HZB13_19730 [Acidobacteria bacterium]|nr:hypothetical protein [Acidobacteriota bacterium]
MKSFAMMLCLMALPLAAADVTGDWKVEGEIAGNPVTPTCTLKQEGAKLSGACKSELGESALKGEVDGEKVKFEYEIDYNGTKYLLTYSATLDSANSMKGTVDAGVASGAFTAKKEK